MLEFYPHRLSGRGALVGSAAALVVFVAIFGIGESGKAQEYSAGADERPTSSIPVSRSGADSLGGSTVVIGDRLKISFFETMDVPANGSLDAGARSALRTFYQRMDFSGEYAVEVDGSISFPRLGRFVVQDRRLDEIQRDLVKAFSKAMGRGADVSITIIERAPVYVVGPLRSPGAYKHTPGMTALQAIALAGGLDKLGFMGTDRGDRVQEFEKLRRAADQLKRLLARQAVLEAERDGGVPRAPEQLLSLVGENDARLALAAEMASSQLDRVKHQQRVEEAAAAIKSVQNELDTLARKSVQIEKQKELRLERIDTIMKLKERAMVSSNTLVTLRTELSDIEVRWQDHLLAVLHAKSRLEQAERAKAGLAAERTATLTKSIAEVKQSIGDVQISVMASADMLPGVLDKAKRLVAMTFGSKPPSHSIVRQTKDGPKMVPATDTSVLMPGDVLKVGEDEDAILPEQPVANLLKQGF
ncbi:polysaccharide biosynthesis/export family protein [Blastochloris sulfoviridis]|uniref:Soluble ligand binding domain-containing protein n=1 Tax=Blastochloris sulfoviridis TaxID=50712 RepID=A0A5M6I6S8_9HYPH|nr:polysaccharide biosynthesis/export family protein [Blastochloris sulfoviridis]KAA5603518.1 hypothetical protein F1193_00010 [Blastochloris sulfoviridis]